MSEMFETTDVEGRASRLGDLRSLVQCITFASLKVERIVWLNVVQPLKAPSYASVLPARWRVP